MSKMQLGNNGLSTLKLAEGFMATLYDDAGKGEGHCTIGYGHLVHYDPCNGEIYSSEIQYINGITVKKSRIPPKKGLHICRNSY